MIAKNANFDNNEHFWAFFCKEKQMNNMCLQMNETLLRNIYLIESVVYLHLVSLPENKLNSWLF